MQHSGSLRYYAGRMTLRYDWLNEAWLDRAVDWLNAHGSHPYFVLEEWEREIFKTRFAGKNRLGRLDLTPVFVYTGAGGPIYLYDPTRAEPTVDYRQVPLVPDLPDCMKPATPPTVAWK